MSDLVEEAVQELLKALRADEALLVEQLAVAVHHPLRRREAGLTALTHRMGQRIRHVAVETEVHLLIKYTSLCDRFSVFNIFSGFWFIRISFYILMVVYLSNGKKPPLALTALRLEIDHTCAAQSLRPVRF